MKSDPPALPSPDKILQTGLGFWASNTLLSAVEMEVFTELEKHPEDLAAITGRLGLHPRAARDFLDALVALGFLRRDEEGGFDYTGADCQSWMEAAGFRETRVEHLVGPDSMVIGIK
ncbi:MAG: methyltransferase dimerization domain-containing protein [Verrucomicrobiales bacterium]